MRTAAAEKAPTIQAHAEAATLRAGAALAARACDRRASLPVLGALRLAVEKGAARIDATDLETWVRVELEAHGTLAPIVVAPRALGAALGVGKQPGDVAVTAGDGVLHVERDGRTFGLRAPCATGDWPADPAAPTGDSAIYAGAELGEVLDWTIPASSPDPTRPHLCAVKFAGDAAIASDGHRLHRHTGLPRFAALAPRRTCEIVRAAIAATGADRVVARCGGERASWQMQGRGLRVTVIGRKVAATFPPWQQVVPREHDATVRIDAGALRAAVQTAHTFGRVGSSRDVGMRLTFGPTNLRIAVQDPDAGDFAETIAAFDGPETARTIGLQASYLADALAPLTGPVTVGVSGELDAIAVRAGERLAVLMPMRV